MKYVSQDPKIVKKLLKICANFLGEFREDFFIF